MATVSATLGGKSLLALNDVGWRFTVGVEPYQRAFTIHRDDRNSLLDKLGDPLGVDLEVNDSAGATLKVRKLYVLRMAPSAHPDQVNVVVADVRWRWHYEWLVRRYNVRRRTGNRSLITTDRVLETALIATDDLRYAPFSLRPDSNYTKKWELRDVVRDVFGTITGSAYVDENAIYANQVEIEGLELDDDGASCAARVLALLPSASCRVDEFGVTHIFNVADGSEQALVDLVEDQQYVGSVLTEFVDMSAERPAKIHVHFTCEDEIRFDFVEFGVPQTRGKDDRWMRNVMPSPILFRDVDSGRTIPPGTWVEITDDLLIAYASQYPAITPQGVTLPLMTLDILQQVWCNGGFNVYLEALAPSGGDPVWAVIYATLRKHYRQTFQVNQRWADRIVGYLPKRVALLDPVNNVYGQPGVWTNYALVPSYRRLGKTDVDPTLYCYIREAFPTPAAAPDTKLDTIADKQAKHATVEVLDDQLGIFHISFFVDPSGDTIDVLPGSIEGLDPGARGASFKLPSAKIDGPLKVLSHSKLKSDHALTLVLTAMTGSPNTLAQTWDQVVTLDDAKSVLPSAVADQLPDAFGPEMHVRVGQSVLSAMFSWSDTFKEQITNALLGIGDRTAYASLLLVNDQYVQDLAKAKAAAVYSGMVDHWEGEPVIAMDPDVKPQGRVSAVEHGLRPDGVSFTKVTLPPPRRQIDVWSLLPEFTRRLIRRILPR